MKTLFIVLVIGGFLGWTLGFGLEKLGGLVFRLAKKWGKN